MKNKKDFLIHFVGIKGVGMAALAILVKQAGFPVTGSDLPEDFITDAALKKEGIIPFSSFSEDHVKAAKLVITTGAHGGFANPEVVTAKANGIAIWTQGDAVGKFMDGTLIAQKPYIGISVAGTHGKTTTTAMLATLFSSLKLDPSFVIGTSAIASLPSPGHFGKGEYFIAEADEYVTEPNLDKTPKLFLQHPKIAILTSVELDHPDIYEDLDAVTDMFATFISNLPSDGLLIACGDDDTVRNILSRASCQVKTYGYSPKNDFSITRVFVSGHQTFFWVKGMGTDLGEFHINVPGEHNALNALGAVIAALEVGQDVASIKKVLEDYKGARRRMEAMGTHPSGAKLYDDYAHHPTEIVKTLRAFRQMYPREHIICVFQPHTYSRTRKLFDQFLNSFPDADTAVLIDIYASAREKPTDDISSLHLVQALKKRHREVIYKKDILEVVQYLNERPLTEKDILITMGAGDIYKLHDLLLAKHD